MLLPRSSSWCLRLAVCLFCFTAPAVLSLPTSSRPSTITSPADVAADCYLRSFGVEFATWLQPPSPISNWTAAVEDGFEMNVLCAGQTYNTTDDNQARYPSPPLAKRPIALQRAEQLLSNCQHHVYVDANSGDDENAGSLSRPVQSIAVGLQLTRTIRINNTPLPQPNVAPPAICLVLRRATYYLSGTTSGIAGLTSAEISSRVGAIALTSVDSGLTVTAYPGEENEVILSGGTPLDQLPWTVYKKTPLGNILQATLPAGLDLNFRAANELYSDTGRLIRAKYPNSDPSTQGLWTEPTGWIAAAESWLPPRQYSPVVDVLVATPARNGTYFPNFHSGIGGRCTVFDPPAGYWCSDNPPAGGSFSSPSGLVDNSTLRSRMANWSRPEQGYVHVLHGAAWGSWVFAIDSIDTATATIHFGIGGTQEGRGAGAGSSYFVTNILEELDSPAEWFIDADNATIYFMPNQSMPHSMVLSQLSCLISVTGSMNDPAHDITIHGLTLTQTSNTYMRLHEMPSGGDFSVHRGAAVYATGTSGFTFTHNLLTQLGSNGITISDWNVNATINENEITFMGGSAIQIIGSAHDIDAVSNINQPHYTHVQSNLIHDLGIYIKQSAGVVQSVARASTLEGNVLFNAPRMQTCFNDGFAGGNVLAYNLGFNGMRETSDAGVFESWDRQPYLTTEGGMGPSLTPAWNHEHHNFAYVNYNTDAVINHDDGSSWYEDYFNLFVYCGYQTYLGHNKHYHDELTIYPDFVDGRPCFETNQSPGALQFDEVYTYNSCVQRRPILTYGIRGCRIESVVDDVGLFIDNSTFYYPKGVQPFIPCTQDGTSKDFSLEEWAALTGLDVNSRVAVSPPIETVIHWARQPLINNTNLHSIQLSRAEHVEKEGGGEEQLDTLSSARAGIERVENE